MPLRSGTSSAIVSANIGRLIREGYPRAQAAAIAYRKARNPLPINPWLLAALAGAIGVWWWSRTQQGGDVIARVINTAGGAAQAAAEAAQDAAAAVGLATPRGLRNNNPGNIERTADKWQGMSPDQSADSRFVVFDSPLWGLRALARVLMNYASKYGANTIASMIARWAPSNENDTAAYIASVSASTGLDPNTPLSDADLAGVVAAIVKHENGQQPYAPELIGQAVQLARSA